MRTMKEYMKSQGDLRPLWRRLRRAKTAKTQAKAVREASGLIREDEQYFSPNPHLIGFNTGHSRIPIIRGYAAEMAKLGSKDHE